LDSAASSSSAVRRRWIWPLDSFDTSSSASPSSTSTSTVVDPSEHTTIGTVGSGYLPLLIAKVAAYRGHGRSWIICPAADVDVMRRLATSSSSSPSDRTLDNLEFVTSSSVERIEELLSETDALMIATDDVDSVVDSSVLSYLLDPARVGGMGGIVRMKRVVAMSRNLNGSGMGMLASASRKAANSQVWDNSNAGQYGEHEASVKLAAAGCGADWTIVRSGTLKGGAAGEQGSEDGGDADYYPQYLNSDEYYAMTKRDIITWQLLFDCNVRGVKLTMGDVLPGPGMTAVFTATGTGEHDGDTGRCGIAEAMVRSLEWEGAANVDFGVGTRKSRTIPTEEEWDRLFRGCFDS
jgi:hypothetical protein